MANLRTSMDASFHDLNIATPQTLHGTVRSIPGEPTPLDGACAGKLLRMQQLSLLGHGFPLGIIPSYAPPLFSSSSSSQKESGSLSLQTLWLKEPKEKWWLGLVSQLRPIKLLSSVKTEALRADSAVPRFKRAVKKLLDPSFYSFGLCSHLDLSESTSVLLNVEHDGQHKKQRTKGILHHKASLDCVFIEKVIIKLAWVFYLRISTKGFTYHIMILYRCSLIAHRLIGCALVHKKIIFILLTKMTCSS
ncbi:putative protein TRIGALACTOSYLDIACYLGLYCEROL 4 [Helianthus annuus]|nr:putative protein TRIGALACTOSYLDIACYLGLYCEROL 4 [Helianthus annuus]